MSSDDKNDPFGSRKVKKPRRVHDPIERELLLKLFRLADKAWAKDRVDVEEHIVTTLKNWMLYAGWRSEGGMPPEAKA